MLDVESPQLPLCVNNSGCSTESWGLRQTYGVHCVPAPTLSKLENIPPPTLSQAPNKQPLNNSAVQRRLPVHTLDNNGPCGHADKPTCPLQRTRRETETWTSSQTDKYTDTKTLSQISALPGGKPPLRLAASLWGQSVSGLLGGREK